MTVFDGCVPELALGDHALEHVANVVSIVWMNVLECVLTHKRIGVVPEDGLRRPIDVPKHARLVDDDDLVLRVIKQDV